MLFTDFCICFGSKGSFLFGFVDSHGRRDLNRTAGSGRWERVPEIESDLLNPRSFDWIWQDRLGFQLDLTKSYGFPTETHAWHLSLAGYRERFGRHTTYSGRFSLPLSFSVSGRCAWVTDLSSSLSFSVTVRISLPLSFLSPADV
jgi:hypothetical protein